MFVGFFAVLILALGSSEAHFREVQLAWPVGGTELSASASYLAQEGELGWL